MYYDFRHRNSLKSNIIETYMNDGVVHIKNVFDKKMCEDAIEEILHLESGISSTNSINLVTEDIGGKVHTKYYQGIYALGKSIRKFFSLGLLELTSWLINEDAVYFSDLEAHLRNPGGGDIPKHQDNFYFNLANAKGATCYIALSSQDKTSGGLSYLLGSHGSVVDHTPSRNPGFSSFLKNEDVRRERGDKIQTFSPVFEIGDVTIHHPNNIHFAEAAGLEVQRGFALSARVFSLNENIDPQGVARYKKLLEANRNR